MLSVARELLSVPVSDMHSYVASASTCTAQTVDEVGTCILSMLPCSGDAHAHAQDFPNERARYHENRHEFTSNCSNFFHLLLHLRFQCAMNQAGINANNLVTCHAFPIVVRPDVCSAPNLHLDKIRLLTTPKQLPPRHGKKLRNPPEEKRI